MRFVNIIGSTGQPLNYRSGSHDAHRASPWLANFLGDEVERATVVSTQHGLRINAQTDEGEQHYLISPNGRYYMWRAGEPQPRTTRKLSDNLVNLARVISNGLVPGHRYLYERQL